MIFLEIMYICRKTTRVMKTLMAFSMLTTLFAALSCDSAAARFTESKLLSYNYSYSGTMAHPITWYRVDTDENGTVRLSWSKYGPDITVLRAPQDLLDRIAQMARDSKLHKLKENYRTRLNVLDGYSWHLELRYEEGKIYSGGYHSWPNAKLRGGIEAINACLEEIIQNATEADVIGHETH